MTDVADVFLWAGNFVPDIVRKGELFQQVILIIKNEMKILFGIAFRMGCSS